MMTDSGVDMRTSNQQLGSTPPSSNNANRDDAHVCFYFQIVPKPKQFPKYGTLYCFE